MFCLGSCQGVAELAGARFGVVFPGRIPFLAAQTDLQRRHEKDRIIV